MNGDTGRYGIYVGHDGLLATSVCHAKDGNEGHGECRHFSFSNTADEAEEKLEHYLTDRMDGTLDGDHVDGTAGGLMDAFRNWLILEKGFDPERLRRPGEGETILSTWFDGDRNRYDAILEEAGRTSLLSPMTAGDTEAKAVNRMAKAGIPIRVISSGTLDDSDSARTDDDTRMWMDINGIDGTVAGNNDDSESVVDVLSTGDSRHDSKEIVAIGGYVQKPKEGNSPDEKALDSRYGKDF